MKSPPTLADAAYATIFDKGMYGRGFGQPNRHWLKQLPHTRKFVLDTSMSRYLADMTQHTLTGGLRKRDVKVHNTRQMARAPHVPTWVEFEFQPYMARTKELGYFTVVGNPAGTNPLRFGWFIEQHPINPAAYRAMELRSTVNIDKLAFIHPLAVVWTCDDTQPPWMLYPVDEASAKENEDLHAGFSVVNERDQYRDGFLDMLTGGETDPARMAQNAFPHIPPVTLWSFLATINDLPFKAIEVKPSHGFMARGNYRKFMQHTVLTLTVPEFKWRRLVAKTAALIRRRAHQVRGHWRRDWRHPGSAQCEHRWQADDDTLTCLRCAGVSLWITEHQRGDASLGFVTHDYEVQHK